MRCLPFALLFGAVLYAQEAPAPQTPEPQEAVTLAQPAAPAPDTTVKSLQDRVLKRLVGAFPSATGRAAINPGAVKLLLTPRKTCSIPLLNVAPKDADKIDPQIVIPGSANAAAQAFSGFVKPPAPPCDTVKR